LHLVQPLRVPGFAFAWLELVSHRLFLPALLSVPGLRGWPLVHRLVIDLLRFVYPYSRRAELNEGLRLLNKGILRVFLVLLHDFPEFLADYAWTFLEIIPLNCLQLRNIVLLAAPPALRFIEPLDRTIPLEMLPEVGLNPRVLGSPHDSLPPKVRSEMEAYLRMRPPFSVSLQAPPHGIHPIVPHGALTAASMLRPLLLADSEEQSAMLNRWSMRTINALVPFLAIVTLSRLTEGNGVSARVPPAATIAAAVNTGASELFRALVFDLDPEGRYALLATAVSHLRFPSAHTLFFSRLIVAVFIDATNLGGQFGDTVREQVIRVISERLLTYRPHPWGLVETFSELVRVGGGRNGVFPSFVHSSPEVERLFDGLLRMVSA
jgi:CCR4-NOT transcription complex subunit 1